MTANSVCVTNDMHDVRSCTIKAEHQTGCDGYEYQWGEHIGQEVATGRMCRGCLPRPATPTTRLCEPCWNSAVSAADAWPALASLLEMFDVLVKGGGEGASASNSPALPIPATKLALDELESYRRGNPESVHAWAADSHGAPNLVRFTQATRRSLRSFPDREHAHITRTRCPHCELLTLVWEPPALTGDPVRIQCRNTACGLTLTQNAITPLEPALEWTGTESSTQRLLEHVQHADNGHGDATATRRIRDVFADVLTLETLSITLTLQRGDSLRRSGNTWERVPNTAIREAQ